MTLRKRIRNWLLLGGVLIGAAGAYVHFHFYLPIGSGPAEPSVPLEPFQTIWSNRRVLLIGIGDSVTAGLGAARTEHSYFRRLERNPPDEFADMAGRSLAAVLPNLTTLNIAVSGSDSSQHVKYIRDRLPAQSADVFGLVVMTSGGNDLIHWYGRTKPRENAMYGATLAQAQPWIANYELRLKEMLALIDERLLGGSLVFLADIYDPSDGIGDPESAGLPSWPDCLPIHNEYNAALRRVAATRTNVRVVPMRDTFLGHGIHCRQFWRKNFDRRDPHYWYYANIEDPNDRGYDAIRRIFLLEMAKCRAELAD